MDLIAGSENGKASSTDILNSADTMTSKKLKKSETEHLLNRLVRDKWLSEVKYCPVLIHIEILAIETKLQSDTHLCSFLFLIWCF